VGKLLYSTVICGDLEGAVVGRSGLLVELQAVIINNPIKLLNPNTNVFVMERPCLSVSFEISMVGWKYKGIEWHGR